MFWHLYLRHEKVYVPTVGQIDKGYYGDTEPVAVILVSDHGELGRAIREMPIRGNPAIPNLPRAEQPPPVVLKYARVKSWNVFACGASTWQIEERDGLFQIMPTQKRPGGGWIVKRDAVETLPAGSTTDDVAERMVSILQDVARNGSV